MNTTTQDLLQEATELCKQILQVSSQVEVKGFHRMFHRISTSNLTLRSKLHLILAFKQIKSAITPEGDFNSLLLSEQSRKHINAHINSLTKH